MISISEPLFNVNENVSSVEALDTKPRRAPAGTPAFLRPSNPSDLMLGGTFLLENIPEKLLEFFHRSIASVVEILHDRFTRQKEVGVACLSTSLNLVSFVSC
jgi:hypothetical protein